MLTLALFYNDRYIATRKLIHLDVGKFIIETNDLGLNIHSLVSINFCCDGLSAGDSMIRIPAVVSALNEHSMEARFEPLGDMELNVLEKFLRNYPRHQH